MGVKSRLLSKAVLGASLVALAAASLCVAPASAGPALNGGRVQAVRAGDAESGRYGNRYEDHRFSTDALRRVQERIDWAYSRGALSPREADRLQDRAESLRDRARAYWRSGGVDWQESRDLDDRFNDLRQEVRHLVWDREYRGNYRDEWRDSRLWSDEGWRGDEKESGRRFESDPDLKGRDEAPPSAGGAKKWTTPKQYSTPKAPEPEAEEDQPFKDGRDFH
ncbi:MAG: hypothetical protein ABWZ40_02285 [Caulobacterales bacterium]